MFFSQVLKRSKEVRAPFLTVYKSELTSLSSIFNRVTGVLIGFFYLFILLFFKWKKFLLLNFFFYNIYFEILVSLDNFLIGFFILFIYFFLYHFIFSLRYLVWENFYIRLGNYYEVDLVDLKRINKWSYWLFFFSILLFLFVVVLI